MALYDKEHIRKLRQEHMKLGNGYIGDNGLIEFDKAIRRLMKEQLKQEDE